LSLFWSDPSWRHPGLGLDDSADRVNDLWQATTSCHKATWTQLAMTGVAPVALPDGAALAFGGNAASTGNDLWQVRVSGDRATWSQPTTACSVPFARSVETLPDRNALLFAGHEGDLSDFSNALSGLIFLTFGGEASEAWGGGDVNELWQVILSTTLRRGRS